jgi:glycosyltransferase involved in cell wall biosynthesis
MSASSTFPRLLFVTPHAFNHVTGGGITFGNLFQGWPKDRLACVHCDSVPTSDDVCNQYYRLSEAEIDIAGPLRIAQRFLRPRRSLADSEAPVTTARTGGERDGLRLAVQRAVLGNTPPERARLSLALEHWIAQFHPDVLFTILGTNGMMDLIELIRVRFGLPLVPHMMDDWPSASYRDGLLGSWQRRRMRRRLKHAFAVAAVRLGIGTAMCAAFEKRYGRPFVPFQNALDVARWSIAAKPDLATGSPARLLYVGSIFANAQLQSLIDCAEAVRDLNRAGLSVRLSIASPDFLSGPHRDRIAIDPSVTIEPPITEDGAFFARLAAADALLLPVNFDAASIRMIRYSMPTKVPAYLLSGTPTLVYGPAGVAQVDYALSRGCGHVVAQREPAALQDGIRRILGDGGLRARLSQTARSIAAAEHDAAVVRGRFQAVLCEAAGLDVRGMKEDAA